MLHHALIYYTIPYHMVPYHTILYHTVFEVKTYYVSVVPNFVYFLSAFKRKEPLTVMIFLLARPKQR